MTDSQDYVTAMIYDVDGRPVKPSPMDDLNYRIQTLMYLYRQHPEWPEKLKDDIKNYVQDSIDLLMKM